MQIGLFPYSHTPISTLAGNCFALGLMNQMQATNALQLQQQVPFLQSQINEIQNLQLTNTVSIYNPEQYMQSITQCCCNIPLSVEICQYNPKKKITIKELDRLIFPIDPIRDWVESEVERISKKYAWLNEV